MQHAQTAQSQRSRCRPKAGHPQKRRDQPEKETGVLRGDLRTTPLPDLLERLASAQATGCIYVQPAARRPLAEESTVVLRDGAIWGVTIPGAEDALGTRLVATNRLSQASLQEALEVQETELATWGLADLLVHLGLADERVVSQLVLEQALSDLTRLCSWESGSWRFRRRDRRGPNLLSALPVAEALTRVADRREA